MDNFLRGVCFGLVAEKNWKCHPKRNEILNYATVAAISLISIKLRYPRKTHPTTRKNRRINECIKCELKILRTIKCELKTKISFYAQGASIDLFIILSFAYFTVACSLHLHSLFFHLKSLGPTSSAARMFISSNKLRANSYFPAFFRLLINARYI